MAKIIAVVNQKGGVGKTTTTVSLTSALGACGKRCLLVDIDPQGNASSGVGINKRGTLRSTYDLLVGEMDAAQILQHTPYRGVDILPGSMQLAGAEIEMVALPRREARLQAGLAALREQYDFILIDCPPSLGLLTLNALCAADTLLVPIQCEYYALEGLSQLMATVRQVKRLYNNELDIEGVLLTMYDGRLNLTQQVAAEVKSFSHARCLPRPSRAVCACRKRPASASRSIIMTADLAARSRMTRWHRKCWPTTDKGGKTVWQPNKADWEEALAPC